jgi:hypothetical protein
MNTDKIDNIDNIEYVLMKENKNIELEDVDNLYEINNIDIIEYIDDISEIENVDELENIDNIDQISEIDEIEDINNIKYIIQIKKEIDNENNFSDIIKNYNFNQKNLNKISKDYNNKYYNNNDTILTNIIKTQKINENRKCYEKWLVENYEHLQNVFYIINLKYLNNKNINLKFKDFTEFCFLYY